jgi:hypothetical protein
MRLLHWDDINPHSVPPGQPYLWSDSNLFSGPMERPMPVSREIPNSSLMAVQNPQFLR